MSVEHGIINRSTYSKCMHGSSASCCRGPGCLCVVTDALETITFSLFLVKLRCTRSRYLVASLQKDNSNGPTAFSVSSERPRNAQSLMLRARFLHLIFYNTPGPTGEHNFFSRRVPTESLSSLVG